MREICIRECGPIRRLLDAGVAATTITNALEGNEQSDYCVGGSANHCGLSPDAQLSVGAAALMLEGQQTVVPTVCELCHAV